MTEPKTSSNSPHMWFVAYYVFLLAVAMLLGLLVSSGDQSDYTVRMPLRIGAIAGMIVLNVIVGLGLMRGSNWARLLFFVITPWSSIALGGAFAPALWTQDIPYTAVLVLVYVPMVFALTRANMIRTVGAKPLTWIRRGGALLAVFCLATFFLHLSVLKSSIPSSNVKVLFEVFFNLPMWHFLPALLVASIPTRQRKSPSGPSLG